MVRARLARACAGVKRCVTCRAWKPLPAFNRRSTASDGRQDRCRECCQAWYREHRLQHLADVEARNQRLRAQLRQRLAAYLRAHPCVDCGTTDIRVLELDHRDAATKTAGVAALLRRTLSWEAVAAEIAKCDVRCVNCHRRRTAIQLGWWRR